MGGNLVGVLAADRDEHRVDPRSAAPAPGLPGYDTLGTLKLLRNTPDIAAYDHSWFILNQTMIKKEFALSGSEQNRDLTNRTSG